MKKIATFPRRWGLAIGLASAAFLGPLPGCGEETANEESSAATLAAEDAPAEVSVTVGTAMNVGALALASVPPAALGIASSVSLYLDADTVQEDETPSSRDATCSAYGTPMSAAGVRMSETDDEFAARSIYCAAAFNTGSPDSALGALTLAGVLTCELERAGAWSRDADFTTAGNNVGEVTLTLSTNCAEAWQVERLADGGDGVYPLSNVTLTALDPTSHGYDKKIAFSFGDSETQEFYIRASDKMIAARSENWAFALDLTAKTIDYETLGESQDHSNNTRYVRRLRLKIAGEIGSTGAFDSITAIEGLRLEGGAVDDTWSYLVTITGDADAAVTQAYTKIGGQLQPTVSWCSADSCRDLTPITASESAINTFHAGAAADLSAHLAETGLISITTVDLSPNVDYDVRR